MGQAQPCTSHSAIPPFGGALDMGRARPCASHGAIPPVWWRPRRGPSSTVHLSQRKSPRLVAVMSRFRALRSRFRVVRSRFEVAWRPKCRPPRRQTPTMGRRGRGGLRSGHNGAWPRVELAREPLNMRVNAFDTHVNLSKCAWAALPTRKSSGPRADQRAHVRVSGPACARVHSSPAPVQG